MFYLDTALLVSGMTNEDESPRIRAWLAKQQARDVHISDWVMTEFSSALSIKLRTRQITRQVRDDALFQFRAAASRTFNRLAVAARHFDHAAQIADHDELGLRGADALHLAVAIDNRLALRTLDKRFAAAARSLGCAAELV